MTTAEELAEAQVTGYCTKVGDQDRGDFDPSNPEDLTACKSEVKEAFQDAWNPG